jgi:hypothetical protein
MPVGASENGGFKMDRLNMLLLPIKRFTKTACANVSLYKRNAASLDLSNFI